jgi:hypothetical protein
VEDHVADMVAQGVIFQEVFDLYHGVLSWFGLIIEGQEHGGIGSTRRPRSLDRSAC